MTQIAGVTKGRGREMTALEAAIVDEHTRDKLYKFAFNKTRHPQDAEDLTQSTVEAALKKDAKGDADAWKGEPPPVMTWLGPLCKVGTEYSTTVPWLPTRPILFPIDSANHISPPGPLAIPIG